jgi:type I restriction enzyme, S subunit
VRDLPAGWQPASFGELMAPEPNSLTDGPFGSKLKTAHYVAGGPRVVRLGNIGVGDFVGNDEAHITDDHYATLLKHRVFAGDLLIAGLADPVGRCCIAPDDLGAAIVKADCFRAKPHPEVSSEYLMRYLNSPQGRAALEANCHGLGRSRINLRDLRAVAVPLAPAPEQRRIVAKLDSLFARTRSAREELARIPRLIEHYKQAILAAAFRGELTADMRSAGEPLEGGPWPIPPDWTWRTFADVGQVQSNLVSASEVLDFPHIAPNHIESGIPRLLPFATVREDGVKSPKHRFFPGQILYSKIRPYLRKAVVVDFEGVCSADMYPISPDGADPLFVLYWLISPDFNSLSIAHQGRTVLPKINQKALYSIPTPVPPLSEQRRIGERLSRAFSDMHGLLAEANKARVLLGNLDQSTLAKAFRGELVPQDPNDEPAAKLLERIRAARAAEPKPKRRRRTAAEPSASTQET